MKNTKLLIFLIALTVVLSVNFAFATDDNATDLAMNADEDIQQKQSIESIDEEILSASDNEDVLGIQQIQTIKMGEVTKRFNGGIQYKATFYDNSANPLKNTEIFFELDDSLDYKITTDSSGVALLTILVNNGNHKIAAFNPVSGNISSANIKVFDVITGGKNINMYYDGGNTYKVKVFDNTGKPVKAGEKVTFTLNGKKHVKKTDKNGFAKLKITLTPGYYYISAAYKDFIVANSVMVKHVLKPATFNNRVVKPTIKYKVKFLGKNKKNKLIKIKFNKKTYKAKTNKKGIAKFILKTPKKLGKYKVVLTYKKSKQYLEYNKY